MNSQPDFDIVSAHRFFAAHCFNSAWEFIDRTDRTPKDNEQMIHLAHASLWHWTQRDDCTQRTLSVGYWQLSRIYAIIGQAENASRYGQLCLEVTPSDDHFCLGYAHEALARATAAAGDLTAARVHLENSRQQAQQITDADERQLLLDDLAELMS